MKIKNARMQNYLTHPTTVLLTGITALGGYCWYDSEARTQAYEWSKQQFEWLKDQFCALPTAGKVVTAGLGVLGLYTYLFNKKKAREEKKAQEALKRDHAILKNRVHPFKKRLRRFEK